MNLVEYWKKRCELAETYIEESPCDPDIYKEQLDAYNNWCEFKKLPIPAFSLLCAVAANTALLLNIYSHLK